MLDVKCKGCGETWGESTPGYLTAKAHTKAGFFSGIDNAHSWLWIADCEACKPSTPCDCPGCAGIGKAHTL